MIGQVGSCGEDSDVEPFVVRRRLMDNKICARPRHGRRVVNCSGSIVSEVEDVWKKCRGHPRNSDPRIVFYDRAVLSRCRVSGRICVDCGGIRWDGAPVVLPNIGCYDGRWRLYQYTSARRVPCGGRHRSWMGPDQGSNHSNRGREESTERKTINSPTTCSAVEVYHLFKPTAWVPARIQQHGAGVGMPETVVLAVVLLLKVV